MMPVLAQRHAVAAQKGKEGKEKQNCADQDNKP